MRTQDFWYDLPEELIAQTPLEQRDSSRLLVLGRVSGEVSHRHFYDVIDLLEPGDLLVLNNSRVIPARLIGEREDTHSPIEFLLLKQKDLDVWEILVRPGKHAKIGNRFVFGGGLLKAEVIDIVEEGNRIVKFEHEGNIYNVLDEIGQMPLPPYITEKLADKERYQTVFADKIGAVAAPASGMHFSKNLLKRLEIRGVDIHTLTSHVGLGNFKPVDVEDLTKHKVESEQITISQAVADAVDKAHENNNMICAVGTEVMRALEHVVGTNGQVKAYDGWTNKFIYPPYDFSVANAFFVNLYMPQSTQLIMVATYGGYDNVMNAYKEAVKEGYRFGDYGDAMLILND